MCVQLAVINTHLTNTCCSTAARLKKKKLMFARSLTTSADCRLELLLPALKTGKNLKKRFLFISSESKERLKVETHTRTLRQRRKG